jgi:hypothetical protein
MLKGEAFKDYLCPPIRSMGDLGGGMSASENRTVNHRGKIIYAGGGPKSTTGGKDLGKNAKNKISGGGLITKPISPSSHAQSRNKK